MTILSKKNQTANVQLHIDKAYALLDEYLPGNYVDLVSKKFKPEDKISKKEIFNVRNKINVQRNPKLKILNAIVEVANEYKSELEKLKKQTA